MSEAWLAAARWLLHMALGGGLLLLLTWLAVRRVRQPARQQRLAECGVVASLVLAVLCLAPSWLVLPVPVRAERGTAGTTPTRPEPAPPAKAGPGRPAPLPHAPDGEEWVAGPAGQEHPAPEAAPSAPSRRPAELPPATAPEAGTALGPETLAAGLVLLYLAGAA